MKGIILASIPLFLPIYMLLQLLFTDNNTPLQIIQTWISRFITNTLSLPGNSDNTNSKKSVGSIATMVIQNHPPPVASQLLAYVLVSIIGYWTTDRLIPIIKSYTLRKGISGKDLGKRGTTLADKDV